MSYEHHAEYDIPTWAICALVNGDPIYDDDDERLFNQWDDNEFSGGVFSFNVSDEVEEFNIDPEFGLPCETVKVSAWRYCEEGAA